MSALLCPDCRLPLSAARMGQARVYACRRCGGGWFPQGQLTAVAGAGKAVVAKIADQLSRARCGKPPSPAEQPACPECWHSLLPNPSTRFRAVRLSACIPCKGHWAPLQSLQALGDALEKPVPANATAPAIGSPIRPAKGRGPLPSWQVTGSCPRCLGDRQIVDCGGVEIELCSDCGGAWLEKGGLARLQARNRTVRHQVLEEARRLRIGKQHKLQRDLLCPTCRQVLTVVTKDNSARCAVPECPHCAAMFVDFYSLPEALSLSALPTSAEAVHR
jgi:Zn-finger nucleic acid-binding protein